MQRVLQRVSQARAAAGMYPQRELIAPGQKVERIHLQIDVAGSRRDLRDVEPVQPGAEFGDQGAKLGRDIERKSRPLDGFARAVVKAKYNALPRPDHRLQLPLLRK